MRQSAIRGRKESFLPSFCSGTIHNVSGKTPFLTCLRGLRESHIFGPANYPLLPYLAVPLMISTGSLSIYLSTGVKEGNC